MNSSDVFQGNIEGFPEISVDYFCGNKMSCSHFFLSHCHTDHIKGLDSQEFKTLAQSSGVKIYCTTATGALVTRRSKLTYLQPLFVFLELDEPYTIPVSKTETIDVCLLDANHCPGSVMFLFGRGKESALYTGDFRVYENDDSFYSDVLKDRRINYLYLDTTFFCPKIPAFKKFPSRQESESAAVRFVEREKEKNPDITVHIDVTPGWENIFISLSEHFECDIQATEELHCHYLGIKQVAFCLTQQFSWIHINKTNNNCSLCTDRTIKLRPSIQWKLHNNLLSNDTMIAAKSGASNSWYVTHSMHSSYNECRHFVEKVGADRVYPIATPPKTSNDEIMKLCRKYWKTVSPVLPLERATLTCVLNKSIITDGIKDSHIDFGNQSATSESDDCLPILTSQTHDQDSIGSSTKKLGKQMAIVNDNITNGYVLDSTENISSEKSISENNCLAHSSVSSSRKKEKREKRYYKRTKEQIFDSSESELEIKPIKPIKTASHVSKKCKQFPKNGNCRKKSATYKKKHFNSSELETERKSVFLKSFIPNRLNANCDPHKSKFATYSTEKAERVFKKRTIIFSSSESEFEAEAGVSQRDNPESQVDRNDLSTNEAIEICGSTKSQTIRMASNTALHVSEHSLDYNSSLPESSISVAINDQDSKQFQKWKYFESSESEFDDVSMLTINIEPKKDTNIRDECGELFKKTGLGYKKAGSSKTKCHADNIVDLFMASDSDVDLSPVAVTNKKNIPRTRTSPSSYPSSDILSIHKIIDDFFCSD